jgi:arylsulfatase
MVYRDYGEGYSGKLNDSCVTFGEVLGQAGYQTMFVGKWHAGHALQARPEVRGFQRVTAVYPHIDSYWKVLEGCDVYRDKSPLIPAGENPVNPYHPDQEFYTTDFFTEAALDYIDSTRQSPDKPFLLHLCYNAPHFPLEAPDDLIAKYRGRYLQGWDILRQEKLERMMESGIVSKNQKLPRVRGYSGQKREGFAYRPVATTDFLPEWASLSADEQSELDFRRAIYAAQIDRMDWNIGRIIAHLKKHRIFDNTLILFFSDNGCSGENQTYGMNWGKFTASNYPEWRKLGGWSISQGQCWAAYSNTPLRKYKRFVHEGGIASPFISHWPRGIKDRGQICSQQVFHLIDIMPTLCELARSSYPESREGLLIPPIRRREHGALSRRCKKISCASDHPLAARNLLGYKTRRLEAGDGRRPEQRLLGTLFPRRGPE